MINFIIKLFIKNHQDVNNLTVRTMYGKLCGIVGIVSNLILTIIKLVMGFLAGSIAIIADGVNNLADVSTSVVTLLGFRLSSIPADKEHPYGHQRSEYIAGLIVSLFVLIVGLNILQSSIQKIINPETINFSNIIFIILIISIAIKLFQMMFYRRVAKIISSKSLRASSFDSLSDIFTTAIVLIGMIIFKTASVNIDAYLGTIISLFIIYSGFKLIKETVSPLLGEAPSQEFLEKIETHLNSYDGILGYHDIIVHSYGPLRTFVTVDVEMDSRLEMIEAHAIVDQIEYDFKEKGLGNLVIHI
ncbi:MAG TPA: cation diffusion facilitator family transporter, partial [Bacilli bacterium]|nr:cation diffusion facilitator family transporter [Bacilli bacterium]